MPYGHRERERLVVVLTVKIIVFVKVLLVVVAKSVLVSHSR